MRYIMLYTTHYLHFVFILYTHIQNDILIITLFTQPLSEEFHQYKTRGGGQRAIQQKIQTNGKRKVEGHFCYIIRSMSKSI